MFHAIEREVGDPVREPVVHVEALLRRVIPAQIDRRPGAQVGRVVNVLNAAPSVIGFVVDAEQHIESVADAACEAHQQRHLDQRRWRRQVIGQHPPRSRHDDRVEIALTQVCSEKAVDRLDLDWTPGQDRHAMFRDQRLQDPRRHAVASARRLQGRLHQQHALHGVLTSAVD